MFCKNLISFLFLLFFLLFLFLLYYFVVFHFNFYSLAVIHKKAYYGHKKYNTLCPIHDDIVQAIIIIETLNCRAAHSTNQKLCKKIQSFLSCTVRSIHTGKVELLPKHIVVNSNDFYTFYSARFPGVQKRNLFRFRVNDRSYT